MDANTPWPLDRSLAGTQKNARNIFFFQNQSKKHVKTSKTLTLTLTVTKQKKNNQKKKKRPFKGQDCTTTQDRSQM